MVSGRSVGRRILTIPEAIDDLAGARETQLLSGQPLERAIVGTQPMNTSAELLVLVEKQRDAIAELVLLGHQRSQVQHAPTSEYDDAGQDRRRRHGSEQNRTLASTTRRTPPPHEARSYTSDPPADKPNHGRRFQ